MNAQSTHIDPIEQGIVIQQIVERLRTCYVFPEQAEQICTQIQKHLQEGVYTQYTEANIFALGLTMDTQDVNHDEHLWVRWHPEELPEVSDQLRSSPTWQDERQLEAMSENFGFSRVEILPGNVGYACFSEEAYRLALQAVLALPMEQNEKTDGRMASDIRAALENLARFDASTVDRIDTR